MWASWRERSVRFSVVSLFAPAKTSTFFGLLGRAEGDSFVPRRFKQQLGLVVVFFKVISRKRCRFRVSVELVIRRTTVHKFRLVRGKPRADGVVVGSVGLGESRIRPRRRGIPVGHARLRDWHAGCPDTRTRRGRGRCGLPERRPVVGDAGKREFGKSRKRGRRGLASRSARIV